MLYVVISFCAFFASLITLFSGFGLATVLMPIVAIFFPVTIAIAITAFVHLMNNLFKLFLLWKNVHWSTTLKFGLPATLAAIPGAWLLGYIANFAPLYSYKFLHITATIEPVKIVAGTLLIFFATLEWFSTQSSSLFSTKWLPIGGLLSGFFGGLSGQQGAFRTPFLLHANLNKNQFVATNAAIAVLVDLSRLFVYGFSFQHLFDHKVPATLLLLTVIAAFLGAIVGVVFLKKITISFIQSLVAILLYILGGCLLLGII
jgi:uncharacterized protein